MYSKDCEHCGNNFTAERSSAKYCSDSCKTLANRNRRLAEERAYVFELQFKEAQKRKKLELEQKFIREEQEAQLRAELERIRNAEHQKQLESARKIKETKSKIKKMVQNREMAAQAAKTRTNRYLLGLGAIVVTGIIQYNTGGIEKEKK